MSIEYVDFKSEGLQDFKALLLPDVYEDLLPEEIREAEGVLCIGAVNDNIPVGALAALMTGEGDTEILSIYVEPSMRRKGIGRELVHECMAAVLGIIEDEATVKHFDRTTLLHIEYVLPKQNFDGFILFLKACGFSLDSEVEPVYELSSEGLKKNPGVASAFAPGFKLPSDVKPFSEVFGEDTSYVEYAAMGGIETEPKYNFYTGAAENPRAIAVLSYGYDEMFNLMTHSNLDTIPEDELLALLEAVFSVLSVDYPGFRISVDGQANVKSELWDKLAAMEGEIYRHGQSFMPVVFTEEAENTEDAWTSAL